MKNLTKTTLSIIAIVFACSFFIQCSDAKKKFLELQVEQLNKQCPVNMGGGITMEKASVEDSNTIKADITVADPSIVTINDDTKAAMAQAIKASPEYKQIKEFGITYIYAFSDSNKNLLGEIKITPEDLN